MVVVRTAPRAANCNVNLTVTERLIYQTAQIVISIRGVPLISMTSSCPVTFIAITKVFRLAGIVSRPDGTTFVKHCLGLVPLTLIDSRCKAVVVET